MHTNTVVSGPIGPIWTCAVVIASYVNMLLIAKLISHVYHEPISIKRRLAFAALAGGLSASTWAFGAGLFGSLPLSNLAHFALSTVNPLLAMAYYYIASRVLHLPAVHSIRMMGHIYLLDMLVIAISRFAVRILSGPNADHMTLVTLDKLASLAVLSLVYLCVRIYQRASGFHISLSDKASPNVHRELLLYMIRTSFAYIVAVVVPLCLANPLTVQRLLIIIFALLLLLDIQIDLRRAMALRLENKKAHINALTAAMEEFSQVKHDFFNILQTYQGYISMGDLDQLKRYHATLANYTLKADNRMALTARAEEHPQLVQLLTKRAELAEHRGVRLYIDIQVDLQHLLLAPEELCKVAALLLDNAIDEASQSPMRHVFFSIEAKPHDERLLTVSHSTTSPNEHSPALIHVRHILAKHTNCAFHTAYYDSEFSTYLGICPPFTA